MRGGRGGGHLRKRRPLKIQRKNSGSGNKCLRRRDLFGIGFVLPKISFDCRLAPSGITFGRVPPVTRNAEIDPGDNDPRLR
jgi:hypothetical protein